MKVLTVTSPFGGRRVGERITDAQQIEDILAGENAHHVVAAETQTTHAGDVTGDNTNQEA